MKIRKLINELSKYDLDSEVYIYNDDGEVRDPKIFPCDNLDLDEWVTYFIIGKE